MVGVVREIRGWSLLLVVGAAWFVVGCAGGASSSSSSSNSSLASALREFASDAGNEEEVGAHNNDDDLAGVVTEESVVAARRGPVRSPGEPGWYRDVPNWPGVKLYGVGAASVPDVSRLDEAKRRAEAAARRQLRGRLRALFAQSVAELLAAQEGAADADEVSLSDPAAPAQLVTRALLGEPGRPTSHAAHRIDALIQPALEAVETTGRTVTVYALLDLEIHVVVDILHEGLRQLWRQRDTTTSPEDHDDELASSEASRRAAQALEAITREELFQRLVKRQEELWGNGNEASSTLPSEVELQAVPEWTVRVPHRPDEAAFGLGRTAQRVDAAGDDAAELGAIIHALQEGAEREARLHLRESLWLKLAWMLDEPFEAHLAASGADVTPYARMRWVRSVARVVAGLAVFAAEREHLLSAPRPGEAGEIRAYTLMRVEVDALLNHLEREIRTAEPPLTLKGNRAKPWQPSRKDLRAIWLEAHAYRGGTTTPH